MTNQTVVSNSLKASRIVVGWIITSAVAPSLAFGQSIDISNYSTAEIVAQISQNVSAIWSLDTTFDVRFGADDSPRRWRFAREQEKWHRTEISTEVERDAERRAGVCFDGSFVYTLVVRELPDGSQEWRHVEVQDGNREPPTHIFPDAMMGSRLPNMGCSIVDVWRLIPPTLVTSADGPPKLVSKSVPGALPETTDILFDVEYSIDVTHDLLPSRILVTQQGVERSVWFQEWNVTDWMKSQDEESGMTRWFPMSGSLLQPGEAPEIFIDVSDVLINSQLQAGLFQPTNVPDGTAVVNATSTGHGAISIVGKDNPVDAVVLEIAKDAREHLKEKEGRSVMWWIVLPCALLILLTAFSVSLRRRRSQQ